MQLIIQLKDNSNEYSTHTYNYINMLVCADDCVHIEKKIYLTIDHKINTTSQTHKILEFDIFINGIETNTPSQYIFPIINGIETFSYDSTGVFTFELNIDKTKLITQINLSDKERDQWIIALKKIPHIMRTLYNC
jgi:hypothetical protein